MRYIVYSKYVKDGKTGYLREFSTMEDAIHHVAKCYRIDKEIGSLGENYYFIKEG